MAARGWTNSTVAAVGASAGLAAAQTGLVYGLGIVVWQPVTSTAAEALWQVSLGWTVWIAASSTVLGAIFTGRLHDGRRPPRRGAGNADRSTGVDRTVRLAWRLTVLLAAAIGAALTVPLVLLPARAAHRSDTFRPEMTAGAYAVVGLIIGLAVAIVAVNARAVAANVAGTAVWVWVLAAISVVAAERAGRTTGTAQLGSWQFDAAGWLRGAAHLPAAVLMLGGAFVVGVFAAMPADRRAGNRAAIAVSGAVGPLLVAAAYVLAAPRPAVGGGQSPAQLFALYAVPAASPGRR